MRAHAALRSGRAGRADLSAAWRSLRAALLRPRVELASVAALALLVTLILAATGDRLTYGYWLYPRPWDHHKYLYMAAHGPFDFHIAPYCWRVGKPLLAALMPFGFQTSFFLLNVVSVWLCGVLLYYLARAFAFDRVLALTGLLLYMSLQWGPKLFLFDFWLPDALVALCMLAAMLAVVRQHDLALALLLILGVTVKESMLFVAPLYYSLNASRLLDRRLAVRTALLAAPAVLTLVAIRLLIPAWNDDPAYIATLSEQQWLVRRGSPHYDYWTAFREDGLGRLNHLTLDMLKSYTLRPFGLLIAALPFLAPRRNLPLLVRFAPFLLLVAAQMLFAQDTERFLVMAFPVVILMALNGLLAVARWLRAPPLALLTFPLALLTAGLAYQRDFFLPLRYQFLAAALALLVLYLAARLVPHATSSTAP